MHLFKRISWLVLLLVAGSVRLDAQCGTLVFNPMTRRFDCIGIQGGGGGGITSLNGLVAANQTFATGTTGLAPNWSSATSTHTLNIPLASTADVTLGGISNAFYNTIVVTTGSYANPAWITSLAGSKITGNISGNAANVTGTVAVANGGTGLTAGTSGGILGYTATGTLASSAVLGANLPVIGGGAGATPTVGTRSGNTTAFVTTTGAQTSGRCVEIDAGGNHIAAANPCGGLTVEDVQTVFSTTPTFTVGSSKSLSAFMITLTDNVSGSTLTTTNATDGQYIAFNICQDGTGGRTFVWPTNVVGEGTVDGAANTCSRQVFQWDATNANAYTPMTVVGGVGSAITFNGSSSGSTVLVPSATASGTLTLPAATDTLVARNTTEALTNKTISGSDNTVTNLGAGAFPTGNAIRKGGFGATFSGSGSALTSGTTAGTSLAYLVLPYACTIQSFDITVDTGTVGFRVWRAATGTNVPTVAGTITTGDLAISVNTALHSTTLTDFSDTTLDENDILAIHINAVSSATWASFGVQCEK